MKRKYLWRLSMLALCAYLLLAQGCGKRKSELYSVAFYNLENLFDTIHDDGKNDYDFLPGGRYAWNTTKYEAKLKNLAHVLSELSRGKVTQGPACIGVAEVENKRVLNDLLKQPTLAQYKYVHYEGPDERGIDCALLYDSLQFQVKHSKLVYSAPFEGDTTDLTRGFLVVDGSLAGERLCLIVNHWPSRLGGEKRSSPKREMAARLTRSMVDSLLAINPEAKVIVMGDLNDDPKNKSVVEVMNAPMTDDYTKLQPGQMFNTSYGLYRRGVGTLCYRGQWNLFDQILITQGLVGKDRSTLKFYGYRIYNDESLNQKSGRYIGYPLRTHAGGVYLNGYSDHYPVFMLVIKNNL